MQTGLPLKELLTAGTELGAVNVMGSIAKGFLGGADRLSVGSQTNVLGNANLAPGDIFSGGLIADAGESASTVASTRLQLVVDHAPASSSSTAEQMRRVERRALEMLRQERAKFVRHDKHGTGRSTL